MAKAELIEHPSANVAAIAGQFNPEQVALIKRTVCKGASDDELKLFMHQAQRTGLDPLARQIYAIKRWDGQANREVMGIQVSIDGFRLIAERTGKYAGQVGPYWCGKNGEWMDVWVADEHPLAARVGVIRTDFKEPCWGVARLASYAQRKKDGTFTRMWNTMPDVMLAKCAESLALRRAFPQELSGLYTSDEMDQADDKRENPHTTKPEDIIDPIEYDENGDPVDNIPRGNPEITRMSKAMARPEYAKLLSDIRSIDAVTDLMEWGTKNKDRVESLPLDWQEILRGEFRDQLVKLGWEPKKAS